MPDIRTALPQQIEAFRESDDASRFVTTRLGEGTSITPNDPTEELATAGPGPVGSGYDITLEVKDPDLWANVNADQLTHELYRLLITYSGGNTVTIEHVGFMANKMRFGSQGTWEGFVITGRGYATDSDDIVTLAPALAP